MQKADLMELAAKEAEKVRKLTKSDMQTLESKMDEISKKGEDLNNKIKTTEAFAFTTVPLLNFSEQKKPSSGRGNPEKQA